MKVKEKSSSQSISVFPKSFITFNFILHIWKWIIILSFTNWDYVKCTFDEALNTYKFFMNRIYIQITKKYILRWFTLILLVDAKIWGESIFFSSYIIERNWFGRRIFLYALWSCYFIWCPNKYIQWIKNHLYHLNVSRHKCNVTCPNVTMKNNSQVHFITSFYQCNVKEEFSGLRQYLAAESPLKWWKMLFISRQKLFLF